MPAQSPFEPSRWPRPSELLRRIKGRDGLAAIVLALCAAVVPVRALAQADSAAPATEAAHSDVPPLPSFEGRTLDGKVLSTSSFPGQRLILFCFNPGVEEARDYAQALARVSPDRSRYNFAIAGVAMGLDPAKAREFAAKYHLDFPIFDDSDGHIVERLGLQSPLMLVGSDPGGRVGLAVVGVEHEPGPSATALEARVRDYLRLPRAGAVVDGKLDDQPIAPPFEAERMHADTPFRLADLAGKPVVLVFFLSTCPHCQDALRFFKAELARFPEKTRPVFVGVATDNRTYAVEGALEEKKLDFFPVLTAEDRKIATAYGSFGQVPDIVLINAAGRIVFREKGWDEMHDPDVMRMRLAQLTGGQVPMLVRRDGFSGNDACATCHPREAETWRFTAHAYAFDTLVTRSADHDPKCVGCHVVGFGEKGGYSESGHQKYLENVGCESCHGRGGGHLESQPKNAAGATTDLRAACAHCHDPEHSLGFDYSTFLPKISHAAIASLADADRARLVADRDRPRDLLPKTSEYVGSAACKSCHEKEYDVWSRSAHARSVASLASKKKQGDAKCISCHVTGYARPGGFPEGGPVAAHEDLARVGCESCHGPGAAHVQDGGKHPAGIVKLGDKCDSCVILQICGTCHDDANDPGFRFNVVHKIDAQRHGPAGPENPNGK